MNRLALSLCPLLCVLPVQAQQQITVRLEPQTPIPELAPAALIPIEVDLPAGATVDAVSISVMLTHSWVGDLVITLGKDGSEAVLLDRLALGTMPFGCGGRNIDALFTDAASVTAESLCQPGPRPVLTGEVLPFSSLSAFTDIQAGGVWTLEVRDDAQFDLGQIERVCLMIGYSTPIPPCSPADLAEPFGLLDNGDITAYFELFESRDPSADLAVPFKQFDYFDVLMYLWLFDTGCL